MPQNRQEPYNTYNRKSKHNMSSNATLKTNVKQPPIPPPKEDETGLLAAINPNRACCCEVTSRALSDDVPKFLGLTNHRAALQISPDEPLHCNPEIKFNEKPKNANNSENATSTKIAQPPTKKKT